MQASDIAIVQSSRDSVAVASNCRVSMTSQKDVTPALQAPHASLPPVSASFLPRLSDPCHHSCLPLASDIAAAARQNIPTSKRRRVGLQVIHLVSQLPRHSHAGTVQDASKGVDRAERSEDAPSS